VRVGCPGTDSAATTLSVVEAVVPSSAVAVIGRSPGSSKQQGILKVALARPEASVVAVIVAARMVTTVLGAKFSTLHVVSTLADLAGMLVTSQVNLGEGGPDRALAIAEATTLSATVSVAAAIRRIVDLRLGDSRAV
jgi:hypothetical protein